MAEIMGYTRTVCENECYEAKLAYSMHLAIKTEKESFTPFNHNSGVLFAKATENPDGSLNAKSLKSPWLFKQKDGGFGVMAVRVEAEGQNDEESRGSVLVWESENLISYRELGLLKLGEAFIDTVSCYYEEKIGAYVICWREEDGILRYGKVPNLTAECVEPLAEKELAVAQQKEEKLQGEVQRMPGEERHLPEGCVSGNILEITEEQADYLRKILWTPVNTGVSFPKQVTASSWEELEKQDAVLYYSDGTTVRRKVDWEKADIDFKKRGRQTVKGAIRQEHFAFPVAINRADPCVARWNGKYYFIATNDADGNHTLYIREADTLEGLVCAPEHLILDSDTYPEIGGLLWAPEFHEINGKLYIFHAATTGEFYWEESHLMELREGGNPVCREDWSRPKRIKCADGSDICEAGKEITLDMTCFFWEEDYYVIWSQRQFLPKDLGAWLYIAKLNPDKPEQLLTKPVILSKPEYGWANNHTFVDEGPFALQTKEKLYVTFSSAAVDVTYVVGCLEIEKGKNLLDASNWRKYNYPILTARSVPGEYGTGHNAYVMDENGLTWNTYHARPGKEGPRSSGIRRVHFDVDGAPMLDVTEERDVLEEFKRVETVLETAGQEE